MSVEQQTLGAEVATQQLWSVTTLIKMGLGVGEPLVNWAAEQTAIAAVDKRATVDAMLKESGRDAAVKWLTRERYNASQKALVRGTNVHAWAEAVALGKTPPPLEPQEEPYAEQLLAWWQRWEPTFVMAEAPVYNLTYRYAGTCDGIVEIAGRRVVFDYKTTDKAPDARSRPPYPEVALQLAAYARAECVGVLAEQRYDSFRKRYYIFDPSAHHEPMPQVDGALCVVVSPYDCFAVPTAIGDDVFRAFRAALEIARFRESRGHFGSPLTAEPRREP